MGILPFSLSFSQFGGAIALILIQFCPIRQADTLCSEHACYTKSKNFVFYSVSVGWGVWGERGIFRTRRAFAD